MTKKLGDEGPELRWEYSLADKFQENMLNNGQDIQFMRIITNFH